MQSWTFTSEFSRMTMDCVCVCGGGGVCTNYSRWNFFTFGTRMPLCPRLHSDFFWCCVHGLKVLTNAHTHITHTHTHTHTHSHTFTHTVKHTHTQFTYWFFLKQFKCFETLFNNITKFTAIMIRNSFLVLTCRLFLLQCHFFMSTVYIFRIIQYILIQQKYFSHNNNDKKQCSHATYSYYNHVNLFISTEQAQEYMMYMTEYRTVSQSFYSL